MSDKYGHKLKIFLIIILFCLNYQSVYAEEFLYYGSGTWGQQTWAAKDIQVAANYDTDNDGFIKYSDFCKFVTPLNTQYSVLLRNRKPVFVD